MSDIPKISDAEITPLSVYRNRRLFMKAGLGLGTVAATASIYRWFNPTDMHTSETAELAGVALATQSETVAQATWLFGRRDADD